MDSLVARAADVAALRRRLLRMTPKIVRAVRLPRLFISYDDLRGEYASRRENLYFGAGFECGQVAGAAQSVVAAVSSTPAARGLAREVRVALTRSHLPRAHTAAILLELARAVILGLRLPRSGSRGHRGSTQ